MVLQPNAFALLEPWFDRGREYRARDGEGGIQSLQGYIADNSAIFRDVFAIAQAQEGELVDGCHVISLTDKSQDLTQVLEALHHSRM